jgi:exonuclease SbcD
LNHYNLREDQIFILNKIVDKAGELRPEAIVIAGDIYDKSIPSAEAVSIFDDFLTKISELKPSIPVFIISGNHDSAERLDFANSILAKHNVFIAGLPPREKDEYLKKVTLKDEYGDIDFYLLPFIKPGYVRHLFEDGEITSYDSAVRKIIERESIDFTKRNVLISHQFFTFKDIKPETCDSEVSLISVGGLDNVDASAVKDFDYVALGHIHGAQRIGYEHVRYAGTLLKYSVSERHHNKALLVVNVKDKNKDVEIEQIKLKPLRDLRLEEGLLADILSRATEANKDDYLSVILKDEIDQYKPKEQLENVYSHILEIRVDNTRTRSRLEASNEEIEIDNPVTAFEKFFFDMQSREMTEDERKAITEIILSVKESI